jgi:hypothetical protein
MLRPPAGGITLNARGCRYLHDFREKALSDHSPIEVDFNP